ncbi:MAG: hypothetical protein COB15_17165 [Flavobacteriales bacterium]|nr:MAG: hypothetical protein COB15_17165 [Flavobacteriales bacterium]
MSLKKIIFFISIGLIIFWVSTPIISLFIPLEFSNKELESTFEQIRFYGIPISILLALCGFIKTNDSNAIIIGKIVTTIIISVLSIFFLFISIFANMCDTTTGKILFENRQNENLKIVEREYGCGATDSEPPNVSIYKIRQLTKYFIYPTKIDTNDLDKNEWEKIND